MVYYGKRNVLIDQGNDNDDNNGVQKTRIATLTVNLPRKVEIVLPEHKHRAMKDDNCYYMHTPRVCLYNYLTMLHRYGKVFHSKVH